LPEEWVREFEKPRLQRMLVPGMMGAGLVPLLWVFVRRLSGRRHRFQWRLYSGAAAVVGLLGAVAAVNRWLQSLEAYNTATPLTNHLVQTALLEGLQALLAAAFTLLAVLAFDVYRQAVEGPCRMAPAGASRAAAVASLVVGGGAFLAWLTSLPPGPRFTLALWDLASADLPAPAIDVLFRAAAASVAATCIASILGFFAVGCLRRLMRSILAGAGVLMWAASQSQTGLQGVAHALQAVLVVGAVVFVYRTVGANFTCLAVAMFWAKLAPEAWLMASQPAPYLKWNAAGALAAALLSGWLILRPRAR
jgi:hypothetical protein